MGELAKACRKSVRAGQRSRAVARSFRLEEADAEMKRLLTEEKIPGDRGSDSRRLVALE